MKVLAVVCVALWVFCALLRLSEVTDEDGWDYAIPVVFISCAVVWAAVAYLAL